MADNQEQPRWYVLHTKSGCEQSVVRDMNNKLERNPEFKEFIFGAPIILYEDDIVEKDGKRKVIQRKKMPNYVFIKMIYTDKVWQFVTSTEGVTGFCGPKGRPLPISNEEVKRNKLETPTVSDLDIKVGDAVKITNGALENFTGTVEVINTEKQKVKVVVEMFGRETPIELDFSEIEKI